MTVSREFEGILESGETIFLDRKKMTNIEVKDAIKGIARAYFDKSCFVFYGAVYDTGSFAGFSFKPGPDHEEKAGE